jgi:hypothetical protein
MRYEGETKCQGNQIGCNIVDGYIYTPDGYRTPHKPPVPHGVKEELTAQMIRIFLDNAGPPWSAARKDAITAIKSAIENA